MFHYTVKNYIDNEEWAVICYACLPRLRSAGYAVQQHDGRKDDTCSLCGKSTLPTTHGKRGFSAPGGKSLPAEDSIARERDK